MSSKIYSRRKFLAQSIAAMGIAMMPFPKLLFAAAAGTKARRQHLINLMDIGGWDSNYTLNFMDPTLSSSLSKTPAGWAPLNKARYGSGDFVSHPSGSKLAPGMKFWSAADFQSVMIARGMNAIAGHGQNQFIFAGGTSPYRAAHSAIVAGYQSDARGPSPLHYVKLSTGTRDFTHSGMMTGNAIPSLLPDPNSWKTLTTPRTGQLTAAALNDAQLVERGIAAIGAASRAKLNRAASKGTVDGYINGYSASVTLSNSNYAQSDAFLSIWLRYFRALQKEASDQLASGVGQMGDFTTQGKLNNNHENPESFDLCYSTLSRTNTTNTSVLTATDSDTFVTWAKMTAWKFALTEFLVINDLSAVVDLSPSGNDSHYNIVSAGAMHILAMAGTRELIRGLKAAPNPDGGGNMLDCTLITYSSEFDREGFWGSDNSLNNYGTSHGTTFSLLMAGHRTNGGRVIGEVTRGDLERDAAFKGSYGGSIAFDPATGGLGGAGINPYAFLPTVLEMMGVPMPPQQVTEYKAVTAWYKP